GAAAPDAIPRMVRRGGPGQWSRVLAPDKAADLSHVQASPADVKFMQGMIGHHQQALDMTELLKARTSSEDMRKLGLRIELSQADEIKMMRRWLQVRGQQVPSDHAMHLHGAVLIPRMLTE